MAPVLAAVTYFGFTKQLLGLEVTLHLTSWSAMKNSIAPLLNNKK